MLQLVSDNFLLLLSKLLVTPKCSLRFFPALGLSTLSLNSRADVKAARLAIYFYVGAGMLMRSIPTSLPPAGCYTVDKAPILSARTVLILFLI